MCAQSIAQPASIEGTVCQQVVGGEVLNKLWHAAQIMGLTRQQMEIDEIAKRIR